ncbi:hypothetical protein DJ021_16560 [Phenylobacterium hankyongense]|uniref:DUF2231 domain-containing protein n=1 Tax=Phenylobacterium hankyongense TaxID=1813876 RepID=A0A328B389_9CAUL|nr:DUF2231 domain-containing protein [Phenylobacterium hankyongense]RAK61297.1 hypothetical protein DJ021_16560 [Phenylobacterium hankyongense]
MAESRHAIQPSHLLHPRLVAPGAALLIAAFATDVIYWRTLLFQWNNFSIWLLATGLVLAALAGLALLLDVARRRIDAMAWGRFAGFTVVALLSLLNAFVHSRDAYTAVVPEGLELSALVTVILLVLGWRGWSLGSVRHAHPSQPGEAA